MTTEFSDVSLQNKKQHGFAKKDSGPLASVYGNLNLSKSGHTSSDRTVHSKSALIDSSSNIGKNMPGYNSYNGHQLEAKKSINMWAKSTGGNLNSMPANYLSDLNSQKDESKIRKNNNSGNAASSSTLSLHIAAYENSIEASNFNGKPDSGKNYSKKQDVIGSRKKLKGLRQLCGSSTSKLQVEPEVMEFKASQKLFNPNHLNSGKKIERVLPRKIPNFHRTDCMESRNEATFMNCIVDRFKCSDRSIDSEAEPCQIPDCKIPITNLLENSAFLITDAALHHELIKKGWYGSRYEAQFDIKLDEKTLLKGEFVWALTPEELIYLACESQIFEVTYSTPTGTKCFTKDDLYREIMSRNLTSAYRFTVYRKLRKMGFVVRSDNTYGGLFTIYEGNPAEYHSAAIIYHEQDDILEYSAFLRVGNTVSKAVVIPSLITSPDSIGPNYSDLANVEVLYTLYDTQRPEGLALAF